MKLELNPNFIVIDNAHPHIGKSIQIFWGHPEMSLFINRIVTDSREGKRAGFSQEVSDALFRLMRHHDILYPQHITYLAWEQAR
jgi:hypothetical protein